MFSHFFQSVVIVVTSSSSSSSSSSPLLSDHHHDQHDDHHCLHVYITSPILNIVNIIIYHKTWRQTTYSSSWRIKFLVRWSVENRSPIVFVRIFFLYYLFIYFYLFPTLFCSSVNSRSVVLISFNFDTVIGHCHKTWQ